MMRVRAKQINKNKRISTIFPSSLFWCVFFFEPVIDDDKSLLLLLLLLTYFLFLFYLFPVYSQCKHKYASTFTYKAINERRKLSGEFHSKKIAYILSVRLPVQKSKITNTKLEKEIIKITEHLISIHPIQMKRLLSMHIAPYIRF